MNRRKHDSEPCCGKEKFSDFSSIATARYGICRTRSPLAKQPGSKPGLGTNSDQPANRRRIRRCHIKHCHYGAHHHQNSDLCKSNAVNRGALNAGAGLLQHFVPLACACAALARLSVSVLSSGARIIGGLGVVFNRDRAVKLAVIGR